MTEQQTLLIYAAGWLPMLAIAIANGALRELGYAKFMTEIRAHQLSSFTAIVAFLFYTYILNRILPLTSARLALQAGGLWLVLTVLFEFIFGYLAAGKTWKELLANYNIFRGRLWTLVLVSVSAAPIVIYLLGGNSK
ncbi:hypothetical protein [Maridesulfovibrio sp. FT414]|uniref:hypothetical protein n=1 Tax=Maridesulfovibrio sp. FT414 TaxID=2979469 RepID=UPI003D805B9A